MTNRALTTEQYEASRWADSGYPQPFPTQQSAFTTVYPLTTPQAVELLKHRGFDIDFPKLSYLIRKEILQPERENERNYHWSESAIDEAASYLESEGRFNATIETAELLGFDPLQDELAFLVARQRTSIRHRADMVMVLIPTGDQSDTKAVVYLSTDEWNNGAKRSLADTTKQAIADSEPERLVTRYREYKARQAKLLKGK